MGPVLRTASTSYIKATESTCATHLRKLTTGSLQATFNQPTTNLQPRNSSTMAQGPVLAFSISYADLCRTLNSVEATVRWCQEKRLLPTERECVCGTECRIVKRSRYPEGICFRCPRKGCQKVTSLRTGTFFENSNLPLETIIRMLHLLQVAYSSRTDVHASHGEPQCQLC